MSEQNKRILGIDYGEKRVGIAITDPLRIFVYPLLTLSNDERLIENLEKVLIEYNVEKIVVGYPYKEDGSKWQVTENIEKFAKILGEKFKLAIEFYDERYSSELAKNRVLQSTSKRSKRREKGIIDRNAAAIILEDYLKDNNLL
ncbi:MAG TPA: Holliday junction resolvase RuvX [Melioribacteraceae bacterium]|nr:Holliday junction resolvase RuvX [Melioribacteraceae bacterium]